MLRVASGESATAWRDALSAPGALDGAQILKEDGGSWVRRATLMGRDVVVKCRMLNSLGRKVKHAVGMGHGHKQWRGAERLMSAGIATGKPLALVLSQVDGARCEVLVLEFVEGKTLLEVLDEIARGVGPGAREQHAIARAVGEMIVAMVVKAGVYNRDHKPSNLVVRRDKSGASGIAVIDCVGLRWRSPMDDGYEQMFASLMIEPIGCGCAPRYGLWGRTLMSIGYKGQRWWRDSPVRLRDLREWVVEPVSELIAKHGDPRPRVDPLAGSRSSGAPPGLGSGKR